jgi:nucleotide-binding universal stress UspA family protein
VRKEELLSEDGVSKELYKIGLCFDPEDNPSPLFDYTFHLAFLLRGEVIVIHALEHIVSTETEEEEGRIKELVEETVQKFNTQRIPYTLKFLYGKDVENFSQLVEKEKINLLAFYFYKKLFGKSLSEQFLEQITNGGLLVVKEKQLFEEIKKILVPLDFSESSFRQKDFILRLKKYAPYGLQIDFLHVLEEDDEAKREEVKMLFSELFDSLGNLRIEVGNPAKVIVELAKREKYNLIILGRTGRGLNIDYGSVTKEVIQEAPCPVVVL